MANICGTSRVQRKVESLMKDLICHCFEYSREDIRQDFHKHGRSTIIEKIAAEKKLGVCECAAKNPSGR